ATVWEDDLYTLASKGMVPKTVRPFLLATGEVGDGDGFFITASTDKLEAALLFANFLMSDAVQLKKLEDTGSRTARRDLATAGRIPDRLASFLVPDAEYQERTRPRINGLISDAAADLFVRQVIAQEAGRPPGRRGRPHAGAARHRQAIRPPARGRRRLARGATRRALDPARPVGLRQVDDAAHHRRADRPRRGRASGRRRAGAA